MNAISRRDSPAGSPGSLPVLRAANEARVLDALHRSGTTSQAGLVRLTGLSAGTVSTIVRKLAADATIVVSQGIAGGRRAHLVSLPATAGAVVGASLSDGSIRIVLGDGTARLLAEEVDIIEARPSSPRYLASIAGVIADVIARCPQAGTLRQVGLSLPESGGGEHRTGWAAHGFPAQEGDAATQLAELLGVGVRTDRAARMELIGELAVGAAQRHDNVIYLKTDPVIDAAILVDGRVLQGADGAAGSIRHFNLREAGPACSCGNQGCLEAYVGVPALAEQLRPAHGDRLSLRRIVQFAEAGDVPSRRVVADAGRHLGRAVGTLCSIFNPDIVLISGHLAALDELFLEPVRTTAERYFSGSAARVPAVTRSALGERAGAVGALHAALRAMSPDAYV